MSDEIYECFKCKGRGVVDNAAFAYINIATHISLQRCPICDGDGKITFKKFLNKAGIPRPNNEEDPNK